MRLDVSAVSSFPDKKAIGKKFLADWSFLTEVGLEIEEFELADCKGVEIIPDEPCCKEERLCWTLDCYWELWLQELEQVEAVVAGEVVETCILGNPSWKGKVCSSNTKFWEM